MDDDADDPEAEVRRMLRGVPTTDRAIVIFPQGSEAGCRWLGYSAEEVANHLYQIADALVEHRIPPRHIRLPRMKPEK